MGYIFNINEKQLRETVDECVSDKQSFRFVMSEDTWNIIKRSSTDLCESKPSSYPRNWGIAVRTVTLLLGIEVVFDDKFKFGEYNLVKIVA